MAYYEIMIKLTKTQVQNLVNAIEEKKATTLIFKLSQIDHDEGTKLLVTDAQLKKINLALQTNQPVTLKFSAKQLQTMYQEMMTGSGILSSIGNFFSNAVSGVKNYFTSPKPPSQRDRYFANKAAEQARKPPTNSQLASKYNQTMENLYPYPETKQSAPPKPKVSKPYNEYKDYGKSYMSRENGLPKVNYNVPKPQPQQSTFDKVAEKVVGFDNYINKIFSY